jgi:hypothetical protein
MRQRQSAAKTVTGLPRDRLGLARRQASTLMLIVEASPLPALDGSEAADDLVHGGTTDTSSTEP